MHHDDHPEIINPKPALDLNDPLYIEKGDLLSNSWSLACDWHDEFGLDAQITFWREDLEPDLAEKFDAWVTENIKTHPIYIAQQKELGK